MRFSSEGRKRSGARSHSAEKKRKRNGEVVIGFFPKFF